jgi:small subunit ribosomal protein S3
VIERTLKRIVITIHTARPGIVIGRGGQEVEKLKEEIKKLSNKDVQINIFEIKRPEIDGMLVAENIAQQLEARISFRRAMKSAVASAMRTGAQGIKVMCNGRLGGAEMSRMEQYKEGRVPLQTLRANIDYGTAEAHTVYGVIGIKVWLFTGEVYGKVDLSPNAVLTTTGGRPKATDDELRRNDRGDRRGGGDRGGNAGGGGGGERRGGGGAGGGRKRTNSSR